MSPDNNPDNQPQGYAQTPEGMRDRWAKELESSKREIKDFREKSKVVIQRYLDHRDLYDTNRKSVNIFWSTVQVLMSSLFSRTPKIDASRTHKDANDDVSRVAAVMLERILNSGVQENGGDARRAFREAIKDRLIVGLGQVWVRYSVETEKVKVPPATDPTTGEIIAPEVEAEVVASEDAPIEYVHWEDFEWSPCRTWEECRWVARKVYLTKEQAVARFGELIAGQLLYTNKGSQSPIDVQASAWTKACIYEIWCKEEKKVYWYSEGCPVILDVREDPLKLDGFWPCPPPLMANLTSSRLLPRSDYAMAQDIYEQIDVLSTRIAWLTKACKVAGLYDMNTGSNVQRLFQEGSELTLIPVDNWAAFAEKGGIQGTIVFAPIKEIAEVITILRTELAQAKEQLYEVIGISDIMRGVSNPNETLGAQQLKAQFGSSRVQAMMNDIAEWVARANRLKAEIISKHFQPETIIKQSNIEATPDAHLAMPAVQLIKNSEAMEWKITIDPDSMAAIDYAQEREARTQMLDSLGVFLERMAPLVQMYPQAMPMALELMRWAMAGFKVGKEIEGVLDRMLDSAASPPPPQPPSPKEEAEVRKLNAQAQKDGAQAMKTMVEASAAMPFANHVQPMAPNPGPTPGGMMP